MRELRQLMAVFLKAGKTLRLYSEDHRFFSKFEEFQKPPRHPKWREVSLTAQVPGWQRFRPAETWLAERALAIKKDFDEFLKAQASAGTTFTITDQEKEALFKQFLLWQASQQ